MPCSKHDDLIVARRSNNNLELNSAKKEAGLLPLLQGDRRLSYSFPMYSEENLVPTAVAAILIWFVHDKAQNLTLLNVIKAYYANVAIAVL